ncbi:DegV family protein [Actinomadura oligospora]|uniref:DegV family protein n=1 Tax=Actinomadura oligospora TaxID=111804 RepID=UPI00047D2009|nr:DegV family protein [Actinomadura oligospora]
MGSAVAVVTDSSSYLPPGLADRHTITVVPLQLAVGGDVRDEDATTAAETARALRERHPVTTSRPSPERFAAAYASAAEAGASAVVSVHLSASMSGTVEAARLAAAESPVPVHVVDSGTIGMGLGFVVLSAASRALDGGTPTDVVAAAERRAALTRSLFYVDNLEHLRRGGRLGAAANLLDSALLVKPLLDVSAGRVRPLEKVRTTSRALARLADLAVAEAASRPVDLGVQHLDASDRAEALAADLRKRVPNATDIHVGEVGPVIGAHVGPGMLGVVVAPLP